MSTFVAPTPTLATVNSVRVFFNDQDFQVQAGQYMISCIGLTAPRTITMPDATTEVPEGKVYIIKDESGDAGTHDLTIIGFGTPGNEQPIDGVVSGAVINSSKGSLTLVSNGVSWYLV